MLSSCRRWVPLASAGPRRPREAEPTMYLQFRSTGLLIGLPDEPGTLLDEGAAVVRFVMRDTDAAGLGLHPDDLTAGVALCRSDRPTGWECAPVSLVIGEPRDESYRPHGVVPEHGSARPTAAPLPPEDPLAPPDHPCMLVLVTSAHLTDGCLREAAALARRRGATVWLAAVGELPESARHAAEERAALTAMLESAARQFGMPVAGIRIELGGDPAHGLLTLAAETQADLVVLPDEQRPIWGRDGLIHELQVRGGPTVVRVNLPRRSVAPVETKHRPPAAGGVPRMMLDGGWVEVCSLDNGAVIARGHLFVHGMPATRQPWYGHLESLRFARGRDALVTGQQYRLQFAEGLQASRVRVDIDDDHINVSNEDGELPPGLGELSEGE